MYENDDYLVQVKCLGNAESLFTWEIWRGDRQLVLQRSPKTFPSRLEALFDSVQSAAVLEFGLMRHLPRLEQII